MAEAKVSSSWTMRIGLIAVLFLGFGGLGLYDGFVKYPAQKQKYDAYQQYFEEHNQSATGWDEYAAERGWPPEIPKERDQGDIVTQYVIIVVCIPIGLIALVWLLMHLPRKVTSDEQGFSVGRLKVPYSAVTSIDKSRWDSKAIAVVHYDHNGHKGEAKIDDWKFKGAGEVLKDIEQHANLGQNESEKITDAEQ